MPIAWSMLRNPEPTTLVAARALAHRGAQWAARAARANLEPLPDDSHSALAWDGARAALLSQPMNGTQVGLRIGVLEVIVADKNGTEAIGLASNTEAEVADWFDGMLKERGLKPASTLKLPYEMPATNFARAVDEGPRLAAVAAWFAAAAELLEELRKKYKRFKPGPTPTRCWPHHFDIATVIELEEKKNARAIGIGLSPGDDYYAQPYFYLSPTPKPADLENLPELPTGGRWHTHEFFGAVATGVEMLAQQDPRSALLAVMDAAFEESLKRLGL